MSSPHQDPNKHAVTVTINRQPYTFDDPHQTGRTLKERAGVPLDDVLFLHRKHEDEVVANEAKIKLKDDDVFHSAPPANYGNQIEAGDVGTEHFEVLPQPDGWTFLIVHDYAVPGGFTPTVVRTLVKLPPAFPDAAPDMFWLSPPVKTSAGAAPLGTSVETVLDTQWQRFSWHLLPGAWRPGVSNLRDYMRCVRSRLEKGN